MEFREKHIGNLLHSARVIRNLTADEVGRRCNVTRSRIYQWDKALFILPKNLRTLSKALGIPIGELEKENGPRPKRKPRRKNRLVSKFARMLTL